MEYIRLDKLVELKQGLAINSNTNHLVSKHETNLALLRIADMPTKKKVVFMSENTPDRYIANEDDIIFTRTGQVGLVFTGQHGVVHNNCFRVIPLDEQRLSRKYLFWALSLKETYYLANTFAAGAAQPDLPHSSFKKIKIPYYPLPIQRKIASVLSSYDRLIENNTKRLLLLEQIAENIYKEWFVRFRFPYYNKDEMENGIPKGWNVIAFGDLISENPKSTIKVSDATNSNGIYPFYTSGKAILKYQDYLVDGTNIFVNTGGVADIKMNIGKSHYSTDTWCIKGIQNYTLFLYSYLCSIKDEIQSSYFEGAALKHLKKQSLKKKKVLVPPSSIIQVYNKQVEPIFLLINKLLTEKENLIKQRDLLLPRLMSGKLEVKP